MAGPWFVDPENGLTTNDGLSADTPWQLIPGQTGATAQTGYGVVSGDVINVKNGTTTALRITAPTNNLTYRGYGVASNVLELTLPDPKNPASTVTRRVARQWGSHEGMWIVAGNAESSAFTSSTATGTVVEDLCVYGNASHTALGAVTFGTSGGSASGATLRRSAIYSANKAAIGFYTTAATVEDVLISFAGEDGILLNATAGNGYRASTTDRISRVCVIEPGYLSEVGDAMQMVPTSNRCESSVQIAGLYVQKSNAFKQSLLLSDCLGGVTLQDFHFVGTDDSQCQIGIDNQRGNVTIKNGYVYKGCIDNAFVRYVTSSGNAASTGAVLTIRNVAIEAEYFHGVFSAADLESAATADGDVVIEDCTVYGRNMPTNAGFANYRATTNLTIGANASMTVRNNAVDINGRGVRLPTGKANDAAWPVTNNGFADVVQHSIGSASSDVIYSSTAAFEAAHSEATNNVQADLLLTDSLKPTPDSPLIGAGTHVSYRRDLEGKQRPNPPSIGAYDVATLRPVLTSDPA